jgi:hypothetical protein
MICLHSGKGNGALSQLDDLHEGRGAVDDVVFVLHVEEQLEDFFVVGIHARESLLKTDE